MQNLNVIELSDDEFEELADLVDAMEAGEDETLKAFQSLCPTGQEGSFDEAKVALYEQLAEKGFIEGVSQDGEFFFEKVTAAGIEAAGNGGKMYLDSAAPAHTSDIGEPDFPPLPSNQPQIQDAGKPEGMVAKTYKSGMLTVAIAAGFIAGLVGGAIAAVIVWALI